jgi:phage shock protein E
MNPWYVLLFAAVLAAWYFVPRAGWIPVATAKPLLSSGAVLIDVRSPAEFSAGSAPGAVNLPLGDLPARIDSLGLAKDTVLILYCASGTRSAMAARSLKQMGYSQTHNLGTLGRARQLR